MKKTLLFAGMAALLASCANQETVEVAQSNAIGFNAYVGKATRADMTASTLNEFNVYGYYGTETEVFDGVKVTNTSGSWVAEETAYWVANQTYNFAAVAPSSIEASFSANGLVLTDYTPSGGDDLIVAVSNPITAQKTGNDAVQLNFKHALAKVQLKLENVGDQEVSTVKLNDVINKGSLTATNETGVVLEWEPSSETNSYNFTLTSNSGALYVIPQELTSDVTVTLTVDGDSKEFLVKQANVGEWETGHVYTYTIDLTPDQEEIKIEVGDIDEWDDTLPEPEEPEEVEKLTDKIYIDFGKGPNDQPIDTWNIIATKNASDVVLTYKNGDETPVKISTNGFDDIYDGAGGEHGDFTSSSIIWPKGVWKDSFYVGSASTLNTATVTISNLNPEQEFDIIVLSARYNAGRDARVTKFEIEETSFTIKQGVKYGNGTDYTNLDDFLERFPFNDLSNTFSGVKANEEGIIEIKVVGEILQAQAGCISAMVISPVVED